MCFEFWRNCPLCQLQRDDRVQNSEFAYLIAFLFRVIFLGLQSGQLAEPFKHLSREMIETYKEVDEGSRRRHRDYLLISDRLPVPLSN